MRVKSLLASAIFSIALFFSISACKTDLPETECPVHHYKQNIVDDEYTLYETETYDPANGIEIEALSKIYTGFTVKSVSKEVDTDGNTAIEIYYDRKIATVSFDTDGGTEIESIKGKYGTPINVVPKPTKDGYFITSWTPAVPDVIPEEDVTCKAAWESKGEVSKILLTIPEIPADTQQIGIYRKSYYDKEWTSYISIDKWGTGFPESLVVEDPFVAINKTYNYKYLIINGSNRIDDAIEFVNGETKNFTPLSGRGELSFKDKPEYTYSYGDATFYLKDNLKLTPEDEAGDYSTFVYYETKDKSWYSTSFNFSTMKKIDLEDDFSYNNIQGRKEIKGFGGGYSKHIDETNLHLWYRGNIEDCSDKNLIAKYSSEQLELELVPDGILVSVSRTANEDEWYSDRVKIYEDGTKLDLYYYLSYSFRTVSTENKIESFVFPFVTEGKTYKFTFDTYNGYSATAEIQATKTSPVQIDYDKIAEAAESYSLENVDANTKLLKMSKYGKHVFSQDCTDLFRYYSQVVYFKEGAGEKPAAIPSSEEENLLNGGTNLFGTDPVTNEKLYWAFDKSDNPTNKNYKIITDIYFSIESYERNTTDYGYYILEYPITQNTYEWTATTP